MSESSGTDWPSVDELLAAISSRWNDAYGLPSNVDVWLSVTCGQQGAWNLVVTHREGLFFIRNSYPLPDRGGLQPSLAAFLEGMGMNGFDWTFEVRRTMRPGATAQDYILGMISELGELADLLKRARREGVPLDRARVLEEWGDVLWYQEALDVLRIDLGRDDEVPDVVDDHLVYVVAWVKHTASRMLRDEVREWCDWSRYQDEARAICVAKLRARYPDGFFVGVKIGRDER